MIYVEYPLVKINDFSVTIADSNFEDVKDHFGKDYSIRKWDEFSVEYIYKRHGFSFSYEINDSIKEVKWFNVNLKKNNVKLSDQIWIKYGTTLKEFTDVYGYGNYNYDASYTGLIMEYDDFDLIIKLNAKDKKYLTVSENIDFNKFIDHKIVGIEVY